VPIKSTELVIPVASMARNDPIDQVHALPRGKSKNKSSSMEFHLHRHLSGYAFTTEVT